MHHRTGRVLSVAALATAAATVVGVTSASAAPAAPARTGGTAASSSLRMPAAYGGYPLQVKTLTTDVVGPLQIAVGPWKSVYVADDFAGVLKRVGVKKPLFTAPKGYEVAGVDVSKDGTIAFTWGNSEKHVFYLTVLRHGKKVFTADVGAFERKYNPDKNVTYGALTNNQTCLTAIAKVTGGPAKYKGIVDTHAYSVKSVRGGWVVGDAAGNDLLNVNWRGKVSLLRVLPPQPFLITAAAAQGMGLPKECVGVTYNFEPVPTDVEQGRDGRLYVTTLPGGPEGAGPLPPRGSVWRLDRNGRHLTRLATGFAGATNLAITTSGRILVAELFAGRISTIEHGKPAPVINLPGVASVEFANHAIYAGATGPMGPNGPTGNGKVVKISVRW
jgi:hypothetical protein